MAHTIPDPGNRVKQHPSPPLHHTKPLLGETRESARKTRTLFVCTSYLLGKDRVCSELATRWQRHLGLWANEGACHPHLIIALSPCFWSTRCKEEIGENLSRQQHASMALSRHGGHLLVDNSRADCNATRLALSPFPGHRSKLTAWKVPSLFTSGAALASWAPISNRSDCSAAQAAYPP